MKGDGAEKSPHTQTPCALPHMHDYRPHGVTHPLAHTTSTNPQMPPGCSCSPPKTQIDARINTYASDTQHTPAGTQHAAINTHIYIHALQYESQIHTNTRACVRAWPRYTHTCSPMCIRSHSTWIHNLYNHMPSMWHSKSTKGCYYRVLGRNHILGSPDILL